MDAQVESRKINGFEKDVFLSILAIILKPSLTKNSPISSILDQIQHFKHMFFSIFHALLQSKIKKENKYVLAPSDKKGPLHSGPEFLKSEKKSEFFFQGTFTHFLFRKIVKFDEESEYGENKMRKKSFRAQIGLLLKTLI